MIVVRGYCRLLDKKEEATYRNDLPVSAASHVELAADTVLVVKDARLDMPRDHKVKGCVRWLMRIINVHVVATDSQLVRCVTTTGDHLVLEKFASEVDLLGLLFEQIIISGVQAFNVPITTDVVLDE